MRLNPKCSGVSVTLAVMAGVARCRKSLPIENDGDCLKPWAFLAREV
jgi:hypothetical protein